MHLVGNLAFSFDISGIFHSHLCRLCNFFFAVFGSVESRLQFGNQRCQFVDVYLRATEKFYCLAASAQWGSAERLQSTCRFFWFHRCLAANVYDVFNVAAFLFPPVEAFARGNAQIVCFLSESCVGIILSEKYAIFGS